MASALGEALSGPSAVLNVRPVSLMVHEAPPSVVLKRTFAEEPSGTPAYSVAGDVGLITRAVMFGFVLARAPVLICVHRLPPLVVLNNPRLEVPKIGRASCRERV